MDNIKLQDIVKAIGGKLLVEGKQRDFSRVVIDSRKVNKGDIFFAIKGENFDAHKFVDNVLENGAGLVIVHKEEEYKSFSEDSSIVLVEDTKKALLDLASFYIDTLDIKVVGITGSTGKTSTKDLIAAALSEKYKVFKTKGNFNNDIGMPLMILELNKDYEVAILEMGMSNLGEIETLARVAKPDIAVITNIGTSHMENLKTRDNILKAKLEITTLFNENNVLIVNGENDKLHDLESNNYKIVKIGTESDYNFKGCRIIINKDNIEFSVKENGRAIDQTIFVPVPGKHNVLNSLLAVAVARHLGVSYEEIAEGIKNLEATSMRLDVIKHEGYTIINDAYNASPDSMIAALEVLKTYEGRKIAVLGTMKELGEESPKAHEEVAKYAKDSKVDMLITLGEFNSDFEAGFGSENFKAFDSIEDIVHYLKQNLKDGDVLLVKASRSMKFENIINELQKKSI
ncbi:MAG: UDP-N-acetylmuramoyl-tripeptide--D-alanyl-D-alanine ligase [Clostridium sp.]|uniref:UDP-N-acetylmuramoyl-tripeptide--D-alanyl-D- alanine ligase n=1 Tax=Clostridium culturomicium TaxID=1499683 RepID=UPI00058BEB00|nr:UDP-N-acetylmuramoyl-tripeptide--D-alanyl-D-alanine ligase [Clostridium culturomicium]MDU4892416.1 UDP-N-acetylmuramoyl-tripeptide--D-alanyl-D-alanine ligase [Clostridium sp.]MDU7084427.1 UDP-N-acetylmuramoyl-tripeptide--D-alanyl-D-alanine ligase [Clostridium sp.]